MAELQRNAFHSKLMALITAYESNANATQSIANFLVASAGIPEKVIALATGLREVRGYKKCEGITENNLPPKAREASEELNFTEEDLRSLCELICLPQEEAHAEAQQDVKATPTPKPTTPPPASPPRGKESGKKE